MSSTTKPSLRLFHSPSLKALLPVLANELNTPLHDPFTSEIVVVPTSDIARYLKRELARSLGSSGNDDGIVSNFSFLYPRQLVNATHSHTTGDLTSLWDLNSLTWTIIEAVIESEANFSVPRFNESPVLIAHRVASLFDRYISHRPEMLNHWSRGAIDDGTSVDEKPNDVTKSQLWQQKLFLKISEKLHSLGSTRAVTNLAEFRQLLNDLSSQKTSVPSRISVFGVSSLSRAARQVLQALSEVSAMTIYMVYFAGESWPNSAGAASQLRDGFDLGGPTHPIASRWGAQIIEAASVMNISNSNRKFIPIENKQASLLERIQFGISSDIKPPLKKLEESDKKELHFASDGTIQVHACYGLARQAEALRDAILHLLNRDPEIRLRDIAILCADTAKAAPVLSAVFNPGHMADSGLPALPINVISGSLSTQDQTLEAFFGLLHLFSGRCSPSSVLDIAAYEAVKRNFNFDDDALTLLNTWAEQLAIKYGLDIEHRKALGMPDAVDEGTWNRALDRLFIGIAVPAEVDRLGPSGVIPFDGIGGSDLITAGGIAEFVFRVQYFVTIFSEKITVSSWCREVNNVIEKFLNVKYNDKKEIVRLRSALRKFGQNTNSKSEVLNKHLFDVVELTTLFQKFFDAEESLFSEKFEAITVTDLNGLPHIPHKIIAIFGADESAFSGARSDGDDVLSMNPCVGEPIYSLDGRQNLLNALMAAQNNLIITCTGSDIANNKELPLSVPVLQLIELSEQYIAQDKPIDGKKNYQTLIVRHPRQNFDSKLMMPGFVFSDLPFTFDSQSEIAHHILAGSIQDEPLLSKQTTNEAQIAKPELINLRSMSKVLINPTEFYVDNILKIRLPKLPENSNDNSLSGDGILNLTIDALTFSSEGRQLLNQISVSNDKPEKVIENWLKLRLLTGLLPPGELGTLIVKELEIEIKAMIKELPDYLRTLSDGIDIDCELGDDYAKLRVNNVYEKDFARIRFKRHSESVILEPWVELATLTKFKKGKKYDSWLVTRGKKPEEPVKEHFWMKGKTDEERLESAEKVLNCIKHLYESASRGPVPIFERASPKLKEGKTKKARVAFEEDLKYSVALNYFFGEQEFDAVLKEVATSQDFLMLGIPQPSEPPSRAEFFAELVWQTVESTIEKSDDQAGVSDDQAGASDD